MMLRTAIVLIGVVCSIGIGCERKGADLAKARPVMEKLLQAQREHRGARGNYWRTGSPTVDRNEAMKNLGVDLGEAGDFDFTFEPREDGPDTILRVTARGRGAAANVSLSCVQEASKPQADCKES